MLALCVSYLKINQIGFIKKVVLFLPGARFMLAGDTLDINGAL